MIYTRVEFAELLGKSHAWIRMFVKQKTLVENIDGCFDSDNPKNAKVIRKWAPIADAKRAAQPPKVEYIPPPPRPKKAPRPTKESVKGPKEPVTLPPAEDPADLPAPKKKNYRFNPEGIDPNSDIGRWESGALDAEKKVLDIEKIKLEIELKKIDEAKKRGEIIPIDLVKELFSQHTRFIISAMKDSIEDLLIQIDSEAHLKPEQLAKLRGKMITALNNAVDKSGINTKKSMKKIVSEFSQTRNVGERDHA